MKMIIDQGAGLYSEMNLPNTPDTRAFVADMQYEYIKEELNSSGEVVVYAKKNTPQGVMG